MSENQDFAMSPGQRLEGIREQDGLLLPGGLPARRGVRCDEVLVQGLRRFVQFGHDLSLAPEVAPTGAVIASELFADDPSHDRAQPGEELCLRMAGEPGDVFLDLEGDFLQQILRVELSLELSPDPESCEQAEIIPVADHQQSQGGSITRLGVVENPADGR